MSNIFSNHTSEPAPSAGAFVGYNVVIQILGEDIAKSERISFDVDNNVRQQYVVGNRTALLIETGLSITGSMRMLYVNTALLRLIIGNEPDLVPKHGTDITSASIDDWMTREIKTPSFAIPEDFYRLPETTISCTFNTSHNGEGTGSHNIDFLNVKFDKFTLSIDANDIILQDVTFFAERIKTITTS